MTRQVLALSGLAGEGWRGAVLIDPALVEGGGTAYLRHIRRNGDSLQVRLATSDSADPEDAGPAFTDAFELSPRAFTFTSDAAGTITLKGPAHEDNTFADPDEPYFWTPDNGRAMGRWFGATRGDFTLTLDDGISEHELRGAAEAGAAETRARVGTGRVRGVSGAAAAGPASTAAHLEVQPALALSDFDAEGLEFDVLALIRAGAGGGGTIFAMPPRGSVGTLLDGEVGLGDGQVAITRMRRRNGTMLLINDNDPLELRDYFSPGGAGADLTLYVQTLDGVASLPVTTHGQEGGNFIQFGPIGTDFDALLDGIAEGDRFIFAFARPARSVVALRGAAPAGAAEVAATLAHVTSNVRSIGGRADAGAAQIHDRLVRVPVHAVRGRANAGGAQARARLRRISRMRLRGVVWSDVPVVQARIQRVLPASERFARTLRESAPERRLLTALEIAHPAIADPVRVVNDTIERIIEGNRYVALRFDARLADDVEGQAPQAELAIDNVGRVLTQWVEATGGGVGATVRVMQVLDIDDPPVEWEVTLDIAGMAVDQERVTARLGFDPLLGRAAVTLRHDPQTSPGLF
ncbi:MAG: DUF1833 family protein [Rhodospirillales bacterium]|nr:DUF1833 family protein [Rhodospirillales bacterium]